MKNLLNKLQNKSTITVLKEKSDSIFSIFTTTVNQLEQVNTEIKTEKEIRSTQIQQLKDECEQLETTEKSNSSMINKINSFLS